MQIEADYTMLRTKLNRLVNSQAGELSLLTIASLDSDNEVHSARYFFLHAYCV